MFLWTCDFTFTSVQQQTWQSPGTLLATPPDDFAPESKKDAAWFTQYARYIVASFYNQPCSPWNGTPQQILRGTSEEAILNWSYIFQSQPNYQYKYITEDYSNRALPASWVAGGKIASLYDHLSGILLGGIENVEVTAQNLSRNVASQRADLLEKLMIKYELDQVAKDMLPTGIEFDPLNDPTADLAGPAEIENYVTSWQDKYSIIAEKIGKAQMMGDDLKEKFLRDGQHQFVGGLSGILTEVEQKRVTNTVIPGFELIWDNRQDDPLGELAMVGGYVKHSLPYLEVIRRYRNHLSQEDIEELQKIAKSGYSNLQDFISFYNTNFGIGNRYNWWNNWGTSAMTLAVATVYFIAPCKFRYKKLPNRYGKERVARIEEDKEYTIDGKKAKGAEINGDYEGYELYQATLIGNKYIVNFGLAPNVLRKHNAKGKPRLPIHTFCNGMTLNRGNSLVAKLRPLQDELDMYAYKIKEKVANDWGKNYVFNGNKFPEVSSTDVANELKSLHVTVSVPSGEPDDPYAGQRLVEAMDMTLDSNIIRYLELRREIMGEMDMITSVSRIALGQQGAVIGKAVQEQTIERNSYGTATLMWGLMKHFNNVLQYNVDLKQMLYQFEDSVEESLVIGDEGSFLLRILNPREFGTQPFQLYLDIANTLDPAMRSELRTIALSAAQNGQLDVVDYLEHILRAPTLNQAIKGMKDARNKRDRENMRLKQQEQDAAMQETIAGIEAKAVADGSQEQLKQDNENFRAILDKFNEQLLKFSEMMGQPPPVMPPPVPPQPSPLSDQLAMAEQAGQQMEQEQQQTV